MAKKKQRRYDVHLFPTVRVKLTNIPASSRLAAIQAAIAQVDFYRLFEDLEGFETEYAEKTDRALVDVVGDEDHKRTIDFNWREGAWLRYDYDKLVEWSEIDDAVRAIEDLKEGTTGHDGSREDHKAKPSRRGDQGSLYPRRAAWLLLGSVRTRPEHARSVIAEALEAGWANRSTPDHGKATPRIGGTVLPRLWLERKSMVS